MNSRVKCDKCGWIKKENFCILWWGRKCPRCGRTIIMTNRDMSIWIPTFLIWLISLPFPKKGKVNMIVDTANGGLKVELKTAEVEEGK